MYVKILVIFKLNVGNDRKKCLVEDKQYFMKNVCRLRYNIWVQNYLDKGKIKCTFIQ